jgi:hypothetical protein
VPNAISEIDWDPKPTLKPGMDFHDGVAYFTVPLHRNVLVPSKKKDGDPHLEKQLQTYIVTSDRQGIWYDAESLDDHGFVPDDQLVQERDNRWERANVKAFLEDEVEGPTSEELYDEIRSIYTRYVEFADEMYHDIMTLFVMYTYVYRLWGSTGYIHYNGTAASGKSRNLSILNTLAFNPIWASSMSPSALYRQLAGSPGTTCIDETEGFEGERGEELRRVLNAGYVNGSKVRRSEKGQNDRWMTVSYDVFGPKALASINPLEAVIASRCLIVSMRPAIRELPDFLPTAPEWVQTRNRLYLWAMENTKDIADLVTQWHDDSDTGKKARLCPKLIGRQWETTGQYIVLADYIGGEHFATKIIAFMNAYFAKQQEALDATDRLRTTLRCLPRVLATKSSHPGNLYSVKDIHEVVSSYMETDATEYFKTKHVTKNLDVLGFKHKVRASGGLRIELSEDAVRHEFMQRRVEPFEEDLDWLAGTRSYQTGERLFEQPVHVPTSSGTHYDHPFWETEEEDG